VQRGAAGTGRRHVPAASARTGLGASYWRLLSVASLSSLADGTLKVALPLLARSYTDATLAIAGVGCAAMLPWLLLSLPAGAIVDRSDRRTVLLTANLVRAAILALSAFLAVIGVGAIALIYLVAFSAGVAETFYATAASAIVPQLVDQTQLDRANALQQIADQATNQFAGRALGGALRRPGARCAGRGVDRCRGDAGRTHWHFPGPSWRTGGGRFAAV
jgi:MFS family permease